VIPKLWQKGLYAT